MALFDPALEYVLRNEGGLIASANDPGGITNMGISLRFLKAIDEERLKSYAIYEEPTDHTIRNLTKAQVHALYQGEFWNHAPFAQITDQALCNYIFDMAVNMGIAPAVKAVQRACWSVFGCRAELPEDGILGPSTLRWINIRGIFSAVRSERAGDYRLIAALNPNEKEFLPDWLNRSYNVDS